MIAPFRTVSGRLIDLFDPRPENISFDDIAEQLAKENRYNGATPGVCYSVAEHSVRGAQWLLPDRTAAAYFLCHDFHEAYLKDDTTPKKRALEAVAAEFGVIAGTITGAFSALTDRLDAAIHAAAGLPWPPTPEIRELVKHADRAMLVTECRDLRPMILTEGVDLTEDQLAETIMPWSWETARRRLRQRCTNLLPALRADAKGGENT